jgi:hypothetical protein
MNATEIVQLIKLNNADAEMERGIVQNRATYAGNGRQQGRRHANRRQRRQPGAAQSAPGLFRIALTPL